MRQLVMVGLFVMVGARPLSAEMLTVSSVTMTGDGPITVLYGDLLPVIADREALMRSPCPDPFAATCDAIAFPFVTVQALLAPITAVSYAVTGIFSVGDTRYDTATPLVFAYAFETPTTYLPLPQWLLLPPDASGARERSSFIVRAIDVTRLEERSSQSVPEPGVWILLLMASLPLVLLRPKPDRRTGVVPGPPPAPTATS